MSKIDLQSEVVALEELIEEVKGKVETEALLHEDRRKMVAKKRMNSIHAKAKAFDQLVKEGKIKREDYLAA